MKYLATITCLALLVFFNSCKKDKAADNSSDSISGRWELESAQTSMIPTINYPPGNGNIIEFTDPIYKRYTNGALTKTGTYRVIQDASVMTEVGLVIPPGQFTNRIIFDNDLTSNKMFFQVSNNRLTFLSGFFPVDGGSNISYLKK